MANFNVQEGMTVRSADGDKLGKVVSVESDTFVIQKGFFFPKDYNASQQQIDSVTDDGIYLKWGTNLVERNYDAVYGGGAYQRDTSSDEWADYSPATRAGGRDQSIPVREEELAAERKGMREVGKVRIHKTVSTEEKHFTVPVTREEVVIERRPATGSSPASGASFQEETTTIPIREEEIEITKRPVVREEIHVSTQERREERPVSGEVRREEVSIDRDAERRPNP